MRSFDFLLSQSQVTNYQKKKSQVTKSYIRIQHKIETIEKEDINTQHVRQTTCRCLVQIQKEK